MSVKTQPRGLSVLDIKPVKLVYN